MVFWVFHLLGILPGYFTELLEFVGIISFEKLFSNMASITREML